MNLIAVRLPQTSISAFWTHTINDIVDDRCGQGVDNNLALTWNSALRCNLKKIGAAIVALPRLQRRTNKPPVAVSLHDTVSITNHVIQVKSVPNAA